MVLRKPWLQLPFLIRDTAIREMVKYGLGLEGIKIARTAKQHTKEIKRFIGKMEVEEVEALLSRDPEEDGILWAVGEILRDLDLYRPGETAITHM